MSKRKSRNHERKKIPPVSNFSVSKDLLSIIIPVYGRFDLLDKCLKAIPEAVGDLSYNIVIVDNNSPEKEEAQEFYNKLSGITVIRNKENLGFPRACNIGVARKSSPLIFLLNSDVVLQKDALINAIKAIDDPKIGVVGMKLIFPSEDLGTLDANIRPAGKVQHVGLATNIRGNFYHIFIGWSPDHPKVMAVREVYAVTGATLLTRRVIWNKIGGFNEIYGGGCLVGNTFIITDKGILELKDLMPKDAQLLQISMKIASEDKERETNLAYINGESETLKITLEKDFSIQGTLNHKVRVMSSNGNIIWKQLDELKIGDYVAIRFKTNLFGVNKLDIDDAYLCGLYLAEGSFEKKGRITISNSDKEIQEFIHNKYGFDVFEKDIKKIHWRLSNTEFSSWMKQYIDLDKTALNKEISKFFLTADKETQIALLQGMFDGDGCAIKDGRINYSTSSYKMAKQLQIMLINFGIVVGIYSRISGGGKTNYLLDFGSDSGIFYSEIGFRLTRKQIKEELVRERRSPIIPFQRNWLIAAYKEISIKEKDDKELYIHINNPSEGVRKDTIQLFVDLAFKSGRNYSDPILSHLGEMLLYDWAWLKVKSIEDGGIQETFDLHVPSNHAYVANGLIVHNTYEDVDFCLSARDLGYNVIVEQTAIGVHFTNGTAEYYKIGYPMQQNQMTFMSRWASKLNYTEANHW